jgi:hypothetical protein
MPTIYRYHLDEHGVIAIHGSGRILEILNRAFYWFTLGIRVEPLQNHDALLLEIVGQRLLLPSFSWYQLLLDFVGNCLVALQSDFC